MAPTETLTRAFDEGTVTRQPMRLIGNKLGELETGLFFAPGTSIWRFPVTLIRNARADKDANIWFLLRNVRLEDDLRDTRFFAQLQFYNKALRYYLRVEGDATVASQDADGPGFPGIYGSHCKNEFLIKLRVCRANFSAPERRRSKAIL